jgi:hypothetical protein
LKIGFKKYYLNLVFLVISISIIACDSEPPVINYPNVVGFKMTGDINMDYISKKGFIAIISGNQNQFQFSTDATINKRSYALVISIFRKAENDTVKTFTVIDPRYTSDKDNYAMISFMSDYGDKTNQRQYWAQTGTVDFSVMNIGLIETKVVGTFNFDATNVRGTDTLKVSVTDGWFNYKRQF